MGSLTRSQMVDEVKFRSGNRTDIDARCLMAVQFAYDELVTSVRVPENQESAVLSLVTDDVRTVYAAPADIYYPVAVRNQTEGERLEPMSIREYDRIKDTASRKKPTHYVWWRNELIIHPPNDTVARTLLMRYIKRLASLSATTSLSALPREWDEVIIQGAIYRVAKWLGLPEAPAELAEYQMMVSRRQDRVAQATGDRNAVANPALILPTAQTSGFAR